MLLCVVGFVFLLMNTSFGQLMIGTARLFVSNGCLAPSPPQVDAVRQALLGLQRIRNKHSFQRSIPVAARVHSHSLTLQDATSETTSSVHQRQRTSNPSTTLDLNERREAKRMSRSIQMLHYAAHGLTQKNFLKFQREIAQQLVSPYQVASVSSNTCTVNLLSSAVAFSAVESYVSLLVRHKAMPQSLYEFRQIVAALLRVTMDQPTPTLPLGPRFANIHASWMVSTAILSWSLTPYRDGCFHATPNHSETNRYAMYVLHSLSLQLITPSVDGVDGPQLRSAETQGPQHVVSEILKLLNVTGDKEQIERAKALLGLSQTPQGGEEASTASMWLLNRMLVRGEWQVVLQSFNGLLASPTTTAGTPLKTQLLYRRKFFSRQNKISDESMKRLERKSKGVARTGRSELQAALTAALVPSTFPKSLVSFEGLGLRTLVFSWRSVVLETLPFALVAAAASQSSDVIEKFRKLDVVKRHLFSSDKESCQKADGGIGYNWTERYQSLPEFIFHHVTVLASLVCDTLEGHRRSLRQLLRPAWMSESFLDWLTQPFATVGEDIPVDLKVEIPPRLFDGDALETIDNLWLSLWLEGLATVGPSSTLIHVLYKLLVVCRLPAVVSTHCASAITTCLGIHLTSQCAAVQSEKEATCAQMILALPPLAFILAFTTKNGSEGPPTPGVVFRGLAHSNFYHCLKNEVITLEASESPAVLLSCRHLRNLTYMPMRTGGHNGTPERLLGQVWQLNWRGIYDHFIDRCKCDTLSSISKTIATFPLPSQDGDKLIALFKPPGVTSTLHVQFPSLIDTLASSHPWSTGGMSSNDNEVSILAQHGLVNRIDIATSGIVLATSGRRSLLRSRRVGLADKGLCKVYYAIVTYVPPTDRQVCTSAHGAQPNPFSSLFFLPPAGIIGEEIFVDGIDFSQKRSFEEGSMNGVARDTRCAVTMFDVIEHFPTRDIYFVRVVLRSGKRHQIRQHFSSIHHPLLGDVKYHPQAGSTLIDRVALHAGEVSLELENEMEVKQMVDILASRRKVCISCDLPSDMLNVLTQLRAEERGGGKGNRTY